MSPARLVAEVFRRDRVLAWTGAWMLVQAAACLALMPFDDRTILGLDPWVKPFKFCVSVAIFLWTLAWFLPSLRVKRRTRALLAYAFSLIMIVEIGCIVLQSARGVRSHFNFETGFDAAIFSAMGTRIGINSVLLVAVLGLFLARPAALPRPYLWAVRLGLLVTVLGSAQGGLIVAHGQHAVGVADGGPGLPQAALDRGQPPRHGGRLHRRLRDRRRRPALSRAGGGTGSVRRPRSFLARLAPRAPAPALGAALQACARVGFRG